MESVFAVVAVAVVAEAVVAVAVAVLAVVVAQGVALADLFVRAESGEELGLG